jgi:hypothetical protein
MSLEVHTTTTTTTTTNGRLALETPTALDNLLDVSRIVVLQALTLLNSTITSNAQLTYPSHAIPGSTIGKHIRHAHAHFSLLLDWAESEDRTVLNYDTRKRMTPMESEVDCAKEELELLNARLERLKSEKGLNLDDPLVLSAVTPDKQVLQSSFGREVRLFYLISYL